MCYYHGGAAPQVKLKAQERIAALVDPALHHLAILIEEAETDAVKLAAIKDLLDRAGLSPKQIHKLQGPGGTPPFLDLTFLRETLQRTMMDVTGKQDCRRT